LIRSSDGPFFSALAGAWVVADVAVAEVALEAAEAAGVSAGAAAGAVEDG
jgi:hypothetical protein